jgi:nucleotide-binding universal stress UspA family protein
MSRAFQTILIPVDFSPHATEALHYAVLLAERFPASLMALHVIAKG